jgi:hypothetical protein
MNHSQTTWQTLRTIALVTFVVAGATSYVMARSHRLVRGESCEKADTNYPTKVNLRFERISVNDALSLLAGFSCNDIKTQIAIPATISPNYTERPWDEVVKEICTQNSLTCWTSEGTLFAADRKLPIEYAFDYVHSKLSPQ